MSLPIALVAGMPILRFKESSMNLLLSVTFVFTLSIDSEDLAFDLS